MSTDDDRQPWVQAATGGGSEEVWFKAVRTVATEATLGEASQFKSWSATLELVEIDEDTQDGARWPLAEVGALQFAVSKGVDWTDLWDAADADSGELAAAVEALMEERVVMALKDRHRTSTAVYVTHLWVHEEVRGHRWGRAAVAHLLDGMALKSAIVMAHGPLNDPEKNVVARVAAGMGATRVPGENLYVSHTSTAGFRAHRKWLDGPIGLA